MILVILVILFFTALVIESTLKKIKDQNDRVIELLEEMRDK